MRERVVVFGGTFDPVHNGHLAVARQALHATGAGELWFLPTGRPNLRDAPEASTGDRLAMLRAAVAGRRGFAVCDMEIRRPSMSYTVDTMRALHRARPDVELTLLLGADAARSVPRWRDSAALLAAESFLIVNRTGAPELGQEEARALGFEPSRTTVLRIDSPDVSASRVRHLAAAGESLAGLVPAAVERMIGRRHLYRGGASRA
jgi:nicotinate-nucleotide adenylyltransferase